MKHISKISRREKQRDGITNMKKGDWVQSARKTDWQPFQGKKNNKKLGISQRVLEKIWKKIYDFQVAKWSKPRIVAQTLNYTDSSLQPDYRN